MLTTHTHTHAGRTQEEKKEGRQSIIQQNERNKEHRRRLDGHKQKTGGEMITRKRYNVQSAQNKPKQDEYIV